MLKQDSSFLKKNIRSSLNRILVCLVIFVFLLIINKNNHSFINKIKSSIFDKSFNFIKINSISKKIFGKEVFYFGKNSDSVQVISTELNIDDVHKYFDGEKFHVSTDLPIGAIQSGVVIYTGYKENYNNTVIIQNVDGYNIWYGNLKDISVKTYDYIEKGSLLGSADGDDIYLLIEKDNRYYTYDEYKENQN